MDDFNDVLKKTLAGPDDEKVERIRREISYGLDSVEATVNRWEKIQRHKVEAIRELTALLDSEPYRTFFAKYVHNVSPQERSGLVSTMSEIERVLERMERERN